MSLTKLRLWRAAIVPILFGVLAGTAAAADFKQLRIPYVGQLDDIAVADLNGDGYADVVTIDKKAKTITVFMGSADLAYSGRFVRAYPNLGSFIIGIADYTGDKKLDVAVDDVLAKTYFAVFPGDGTGYLRTPKTVNTSLAKEPNLSFAAVADFNNDLRPDILGLLKGDYYSNPSSVMAFKNLGAGKFGKAKIIEKAYYGVTAGDFTSDKFADILLGNIMDDTVTLYKGNGKGAFTAGPVLKPGDVGANLGQADFNKDKKLDIICGGSQSAWTYLGKGNGTFGGKKTFPAWHWLSNGFALSDLTRDGKLDVAEPLLGGIDIHAGKGTGGFAPPVRIGQGLYFGRNNDLNGSQNVAAGDLNNDGRPDLAGAHWDGYNGRSPAMTDLIMFINGQPPVTLAVANLNVTTLSFSALVVNFAGNFTFQTSGGDVKYMAAPDITDNAFLEFKIKLDFPYPMRDYIYTYIATGTYLNFPGQQTGFVSFNLILPTTVVTTATPTVTLSDFSLRDYNLVQSNELLATSPRAGSDAVIGVRADR